MGFSGEMGLKVGSLEMLPEVTQEISGTEKKMHTEAETGGGGPGRSSEGAPMREEVARSQERSAFQELRAHVWICQGWPRDAGAR